MKPILFNTEMVRAILDGRKTVTRRVVKPHPLERAENPHKINSGNWYFDIPHRTFRGVEASVGPYRPPCRPGDILYVRETWCDPSGTGYPFLYKADMPMHWDAENTEIGIPVDLKAEDYTWRPSIHMPKEAARLFLKVKAVRVERLHDMTANSAMDEGFTDWNDFVRCWDSTIKTAARALYGWAANPWVWVIEFEQISKEAL